MAGQQFRFVSSSGGPDTQSEWTDYVIQHVDLNDIANNEWPVYVAPKVSPYSAQGNAPNPLPTSGLIKTLVGVYVMFDANVAANRNTTIAFNLRRAGAVIGGGTFAGWASGATPAFSAWVPIVVPFLITNTALAPVPTIGTSTPASATRALLKLQPLDIITSTFTDHTQLSANMFVLLDVQ